MKKWEENKEGIADALKAMWEACQKDDFDTAAEELREVSVVRFSGGPAFVFEPRKSLPLTVV